MANETEKTEKPVARKYPVARLLAESEAFLGHPRHVAAGALHDRNPDSEMTVEAAVKAIETWLGRSVAA